jgi:hypothetical protein
MTASSQLDLKQRLARLSEKDRLAISAYLLRLKHQSKSGRRALSKIMSEMDAGKKPNSPTSVPATATSPESFTTGSIHK